MNSNTPVEKVAHIGPVRKQQLNWRGIRTIGDLRKMMYRLRGPQNLRNYLFGVFGIRDPRINDVTVSSLVQAATGRSQ